MQHRWAKFREKIRDVDKKIPGASDLATANILNTKISKAWNETSDNLKCIYTQEFNKLTAVNFASRIKQADLVSKADFDNKETIFNRRLIFNIIFKTKHLKVQKKLRSLITNDYNFFLGRNFFTSNDWSQNTFVY